MSIDVEPLRKILELEQKKGYADSAVIGGLDKFIDNWTGKAIESSVAPHLLKQLKILAVQADKRQNDLLEEAIKDLLKKYGKGSKK